MADFAKILLLLLSCNGAPVLVARVMGSHWAAPVDGGRHLADSYPLFGASKTWRGLAAMLVTGGVVSGLLGYGVCFGLLVAALAASGDLLSSFCKRRRALEPSAPCIGLDQLPESALPSWYAVAVLGLPWVYALTLPLVFVLAQLLLSRPLFWLHIRKQPY